MKYQKYMLSAVAALAAFGVGFGLIELVRALLPAEPAKIEQPSPVRQLTVADVTFPTPASAKPEIAAPAPPEIAPAAEPAPEPDETAQTPFNPTDAYYAVDKLPKGFRDFEELSLATVDYSTANEKNDYRPTPIPPKGTLLMKKNFAFKTVAVSPEFLSFETETVKGVKYRFAGRFVNEEVESEEYSETVVIKGRLMKYRDGRKVGETELRLAVLHGC